MSILRSARAVAAVAAFTLAACEKNNFSDPASPASLDAQVRQSIGQWGVVPILPLAAQNAAQVELGRALFFDKVLSGNRDVSCATCHTAVTGTGDGLSLAVGTGGVGAGASRVLGAGRQFVPRNAQSLFSVGLGGNYLFWDGRVSDGLGSTTRFTTPAGTALPFGLINVLAAQAMMPVTNRVEMRGQPGDRDVFGAANELAVPGDTQYTAIWQATMKRLLAIPEYVQKFNAAYPNSSIVQLGFQDAANAIAAFETQTFTKSNSRFDRYLARDNSALTADEKQGALLFFGKARCSQCHNGPFLGGQSFASVGVPQLGPGTGSFAPLDGGREDGFVPPGQKAQARFMFRIAPLRNVELSAPYFHDGVYATLEQVVRHYSNADSALRAFDPSTLPAALRASYHGDAATINALSLNLDFRLRPAIGLTPDEQKLLVAFLKSLTDPSARDLSGIVPASVPSGLPIK